MGAVTQVFSKVKDISFVQQALDYCKAHPILIGVLAGIVLFICLVVVILIIKGIANGNKRKKAAKQAAEAAEKAKAEAAAKRAQEREAKAKAEAAEAQAAREQLAAAKAETEKAKATATENPAKSTTPPTAKKAESAKPAAKPAAKPVPAKTVDKSKAYEEDETEKQGRYTGKWVVSRLYTEIDGKRADEEEMYFFELIASNGEKLLTSEEYTSYAGAVKGIETHKANIEKGNFRITLSKKGHYIFKLLSGKNTLLCMGENYTTKTRCEKAVESTKRFAQTAVLVEEVQEQIVKVPKEDDAPIAPLPEGMTGKWLIDSGVGADGETVYYFELYANNGEKLLTSEEYTSYTGAVNGIATHKKNIENGNFRITLTKHGDYIYKLLNGNGQLLCLGEHYKTKRLCMNAVESVKRFAANSPTLTEENTAKAQK